MKKVWNHHKSEQEPELAYKVVFRASKFQKITSLEASGSTEQMSNPAYIARTQTSLIWLSVNDL